MCIRDSGALRGKGAMQYFMISTFTDLILRVVLAFVLARPYGSTGIWLSWPIGWLVSTVLSVVFARVKVMKNELNEEWQSQPNKSQVISKIKSRAQ